MNAPFPSLAISNGSVPTENRPGPCAKKAVRFTLVTRGGLRFIGTNECRNPQTTCSRLPGEGYEKCRSICAQPAHAEVAALERAGRRAMGAIGFLEGIDHVCPECQAALDAAGVRSVVFGSPDWESGDDET